MIWYTPQFLAQFSSEEDMNTFVDLIFTETDQGYINSGIPVSDKSCVKIMILISKVRVKKLGPKLHQTLNDIYDSSLMISEFESSLPHYELLNCADAAALLIADFSHCGIAKVRATGSCRTFSVTKKSCATGYYRSCF